MKSPNKYNLPNQHVLVDVRLDNQTPGQPKVILCFRRDDGTPWGYQINLNVATPIQDVAVVLNGKDLLKMAANLPKPEKK